MLCWLWEEEVCFIKVGLEAYSAECVCLYEACGDLSLFFNTHVVRVKLDPKEVTELQELFTWRGCWKHCNMSNWNSNKPNKLAHIYWQFREMKVLISTGHRPTSSQTEAVLMGWGWGKTLPKAYLVLPRHEMPLKCWRLKQSLFQLRISLFCCPLTSLALPL